MRIAIEASVLARGVTSGVERYTRELLRRLVVRMPDDEFLLCVLGGGEVRGFGAPNVSHRRRWVSPRAYKAFATYWRAPPYDWLMGTYPDVFLFPDFVRFPLRGRGRSVVVVYDLSFLRMPQYVTPRNREYLTRMVERSVTESDAVVAISESVKTELVHQYSLGVDKISVVHPGVEPAVFGRPQDAAGSRLARYRLPDEYVLFVGTLEPRKNIAGLLAAYVGLPASLRRRYALVLAGRLGWFADEIRQTISSLRARGEAIVVTGYVPDADLPAIYANASLFVYPSFYEGFGIPPIEAMAAGVPVVVADAPSLREAVGDAALVATHDAADLTDRISQALLDGKLREDLIRKGQRQSARFSWDVSAQKLQSLLASLNAIGGGGTTGSA